MQIIRKGKYSDGKPANEMCKCRSVVVLSPIPCISRKMEDKAADLNVQFTKLNCVRCYEIEQKIAFMSASDM